MADCTELHAPHLALLRAALEAASPLGAQVALDLACGSGGKTTWLIEQAAPAALVLGLDLDPFALRLARAALPHVPWVNADAHTLPIASGTIDLIWCVAAFGLFAEPGRVLSELRRVLAPGGTLVLALASTRWVRRRRWTTQVAGRVRLGHAAPADDLGADVRATLTNAGLSQVALTAYLLEPPDLAPLAAQLALADLGPAAPLFIDEPEPLPLLMVATGKR